MTKMKALVKKHPQKGLWMEEVPVPAFGPDEVLLKIKKASICGTDLHIYNWDDWSKQNITCPTILGHEFMGEIVAVGNKVTHLSVGEVCSAEGHLTCGTCRNCTGGLRHLCRSTVGVGVHRAGGFAEYVALPAGNIFKLPQDIDPDLGAIFDPFGNAVHTALSFDLSGEDVLITGAGPIGIMAAKVARFCGARHIVITDVNPYRLKLAASLANCKAVNPKEQSLESVMKELGMREGFDIGMEMSGNGAAFKDMISTMNHGGQVATLGIFSSAVEIDWNQAIFKGLNIRGIYGRKIFGTWYKMASLLQSGLDLSGIITHKVSFEDFETGFSLMAKGECGKVLLSWN